MYIHSVELQRFRGISSVIHLSNPMALIVGENNAGKSSLIDAIRLVLGGADNNDPSRLWVRETDFSFSSAGEYVEPRQFSIHLDIRGLDSQQRGRMITCLAPSVGPNCARLSLEATWDGVARPQVYITGGENGNRDIEFFARETVRCIYLPPLRDATRDLRPGASNRLRQLVNFYAKPDSEDRTELVAAMSEANTKLRGISAIQAANLAVTQRLDGITGNQAFRQRAEVTFSDPTYERVVGNLRALMGTGAPMELETNGLGFNNILYMSVLLAAIQNVEDGCLDVLLIEEPEAHLHPQLQELLSAYLASGAGEKMQVVATTHSQQFASSAPIEQLTILNKSANSRPYAVSLESLNLADEKIRYLKRFLDVTKAGLFFARGVILVEGIAEQMLMPTFARICGFDLNDAGVSVLNVNGLNFSSFVSIFGEKSLPIPCSVITDSDRTWTITGEEDSEDNASVNAEDEPALGPESAYARKAVSEFANSYVKVFLADITLEKDLVHPFTPTQKDMLLSALQPVRPKLAASLATDAPMESEWTDRFYNAVKSRKGDFAQSLASMLDDASPKDREAFEVPEYIRSAIGWACGNLEPSATAADAATTEPGREGAQRGYTAPEAFDDFLDEGLFAEDDDDH